MIPIRHRLFPHAAYVPPAATESDIVRHSTACVEGTACMESQRSSAACMEGTACCMESQRPRFELKVKVKVKFINLC